MVKLVAATGVVLLVLGFAGFGAYRVLVTPIRVIVRNASGEPLENVRVTVHPYDGAAPIIGHARIIKPGAEFVIRHGVHDFRVTIAFRRLGGDHEHPAGFAPLGPFQGWVVEVQPDGSVKSDFESLMPRAAP